MILVERIDDLRDALRGRAPRRAGRSGSSRRWASSTRVTARSCAARTPHDLVVVTIFVNPLQFGPNEDLDAYPRDLDGDAAAAEAEGVDLLFAPTSTRCTREPPRTTVHVAGLTEGLCGAARPTHFDGVTTVVAKLFSIVGPCRAYFGRKDFQQLAVVRRMAADLDLPVEVVGCPLVREPDGLAMSSRNAYLAADERDARAGLFAALRAGAAPSSDGERERRRAAPSRRSAPALPVARFEYAEVAGPPTSRRVDDLAGESSWPWPRESARPA